jgi:hypothetical protein
VAISIAAVFIIVGRTWGQVLAAHTRIDALEKQFAGQFQEIAARVESMGATLIKMLEKSEERSIEAMRVFRLYESAVSSSREEKD